jgi:FKBP-type peptidyl-prolyl cis-trans isomerase 2
VVTCFIGVSEGIENQTKEESKMVTEGNMVKVNYTLKVDGNVIDRSPEGKPLEYQIGGGQVIPGFEEALMGMKVGEKKSFELSPDKGYGQEDPKAIQTVSRDNLPSDITPQVGMTLYAKMSDGQQTPIRIIEVNEDTIVVNLNHPLAGRTLNFDVEVIDVN